ncbi:EF-hand domain-containing protein, partial [Salmonella sp. s51228]|uniref:EF-hand domain-containing protein n=1 Tax=Salmonella sp. s51228 TaxID=3159652 RepID=UPI00398008C9
MKTYGEQRDREQAKFNSADTDKDGKLSVNEFKTFIFPHSFDHMRDVAIQEHMYDMDFDKSRTITEAEYLKYTSLITTPSEFKKNQDHYKYEFQQRDLNSDGSINRDELATWVFPEGFSRSTAE